MDAHLFSSAPSWQFDPPPPHTPPPGGPVGAPLYTQAKRARKVSRRGFFNHSLRCPPDPGFPAPRLTGLPPTAMFCLIGPQSIHLGPDFSIFQDAACPSQRLFGGRAVSFFSFWSRPPFFALRPTNLLVKFSKSGIFFRGWLEVHVPLSPHLKGFRFFILPPSQVPGSWSF